MVPHLLLGFLLAMARTNGPPSRFLLDSFGCNIGTLSQASEVIFIDLDNVRGKLDFKYSHTQILDSIATWTDHCRLHGKVILVVDHGSEESAFWLDDIGLSVLFSGSSKKADDVIAKHVSIFDTEHVVIVTADQELISRCQSAVRGKRLLRVVQPQKFLDALESVLSSPSKFINSVNESAVDDDINSPFNPVEIDREIDLWAHLLKAEAKMKSTSRINNRQRKRIQSKVNTLRIAIARRGESFLKKTTEIPIDDENKNSPWKLDETEQNRILSRFARHARLRNKERTGDRVMLAEHLRRSLKERYGFQTSGHENLSVAQTHVNYVTSRKAIDVTETLTLVVVSDTHGFEESLTSEEEGLPPGDILLHLGDFAVDDGARLEALRKFDAWLARQPHHHKIVLRGNHDPRHFTFPLSGSKYITEPQCEDIGDFVFAFFPFVLGKYEQHIPNNCDVVVSHVPPKGILDRTMRGIHAGSHSLRSSIERFQGSPPKLWLCGHIHEARGFVKHVFSKAKETLVVNAANANSGMATCIQHGPVLLKLVSDGQKRIELMDGCVQPNRSRETTLEALKGLQDKVTSTASREMLLAVDLGLRTGVSLYDESGHLVRYDNFCFTNIEELQKASWALLQQWENDANEIESDDSYPLRVAYIAIEGSSPPVRVAWQALANERRRVFGVRPEEWRAALLSRKEMKSGVTCKEAARLIARQIVGDFSLTGQHQGKFQTDCAEAVCMGYHVARSLGWIDREIAVRRYTNGNVVVPRKGM